MTCGQKITQLRKNANMTQGQLGEKLNVSSQAVSKWEHDQAEPDLNTIKNIAKLFDISIDELLDFESPQVAVAEQTQQVDPNTVADTVSSVVVDAIKQSQPVIPIGYCSECGIMVNEENLGQKEPRVLCKKCLSVQQKIAENKRIKLEERDNTVISRIKRKKRKSIIFGLIAVAIIMAIYFYISIHGNDTVGTKIGAFFICAFISYCAYAAITDLTFMEGLIFNLLSNIVATRGRVFSFIICWFGLMIDLVISPFTFPLTIRKINWKIRKQNPITDDDLCKYLSEDEILLYL